MKKILILSILVFLAASFAFAENFKVESVTGRVEREVSGQRVTVKAGDTLTSENVIYTAVGASVVLNDGSRSVTIPAAKNGSVDELVKAASCVRIGGNVARTDTSTVTRTVAGTGTASARASDQAGDDDIAAE